MTEEIDIRNLLEKLAERLSHEEKFADLMAIARTGYSFEGWFKWEAYSCWHNSDRNIDVEKPYKGSPLRLCDLVVEDLWIELAVVHDWTSNKWISKIVDDLKKVRQSKSGHGSVIVLCTHHPETTAFGDQKDVDASKKSWSSFFSSLQDNLENDENQIEGSSLVKIGTDFTNRLNNKVALLISMSVTVNDQKIAVKDHLLPLDQSVS